MRPLGDGAGGWPLGCMPCGTAKPQPKVGSRYPEGRGPVEKGVGAGTGRTGAAGKAEEAGSRDTSGAGGTVGKGNLAEKRGSSCSKAGAEATGGNEGGVQGCGPCTLSGAGYWRRDGGTGGGGSLGLGSSRRRKSELRKVLGSKEPGQLLRAWFGDRETLSRGEGCPYSNSGSLLPSLVSGLGAGKRQENLSLLPAHMIACTHTEIIINEQSEHDTFMHKLGMTKSINLPAHPFICQALYLST